MLKRFALLWFTLLVAAALSAAAESTGNAAETLREAFGPEYEIMLHLDDTRVLDDEHNLAEWVRTRLETGEKCQGYGVIYLDTPERDYLHSGWINRIRVKEGKKKYTFTFKKRYPVHGGNVESALDAALADGFTPADPDISAEIDWGYNRMTLSLTAEAELKLEEKADIHHLESGEAARLTAAYMPPQERNRANQSPAAPEAGVLEKIGPLRFVRYTGTLERHSVRIEIWPMPFSGEMRYLTKFSAKCKTAGEAVKLREDCIRALDEMGILLHDDTFKSEWILRRQEKASQ